MPAFSVIPAGTFAIRDPAELSIDSSNTEISFKDQPNHIELILKIKITKSDSVVAGPNTVDFDPYAQFELDRPSIQNGPFTSLAMLIDVDPSDPNNDDRATVRLSTQNSEFDVKTAGRKKRSGGALGPNR